MKGQARLTKEETKLGTISPEQAKSTDIDDTVSAKNHFNYALKQTEPDASPITSGLHAAHEKCISRSAIANHTGDI